MMIADPIHCFNLSQYFREYCVIVLLAVLDRETDRQTDRWTEGRTNEQSYRYAVS